MYLFKTNYLSFWKSNKIPVIPFFKRASCENRKIFGAPLCQEGWIRLKNAFFAANANKKSSSFETAFL